MRSVWLRNRVHQALSSLCRLASRGVSSAVRFSFHGSGASFHENNVMVTYSRDSFAFPNKAWPVGKENI